jgi:hypothetical protein
VELEIPDQTEAFEWHQRVSNLVIEKLAPALNQLFDRTVSNHQLLQLDRLDISINFKNSQVLYNQFTDKVIQVIESELKKYADDEFLSLTKNNHGQNFKAFLFFLNNGYLPWWATFDNHSTFQNYILEALHLMPATQLEPALKAVFKSRVAGQRLLYQFNAELVNQVIYLIAPDNSIAWFKEWEKSLLNEKENLADHYGRLGNSYLQYKFYFILACSQELNGLSDFELRFFKDLFHNDISPLDVNAKSASSDKNTLPGGDDSLFEESNDIYIQNAGLILLSPFLQTFLEAGDLLKDNKIINPAKALHAIQYLVTFHTQTPEYELQLNKILCGLPVNAPIPFEIELPEKVLQEAHQLLETVIEYWYALKNTTPSGLQEGFLQRRGKLTLKANGDWLLQIEHKSYDILLESLPWAYNLVKLPWMEQLLWVEYS